MSVTPSRKVTEFPRPATGLTDSSPLTILSTPIPSPIAAAAAASAFVTPAFPGTQRRTETLEPLRSSSTREPAKPFERSLTTRTSAAAVHPKEIIRAGCARSLHSAKFDWSAFKTATLDGDSPSRISPLVDTMLSKLPKRPTCASSALSNTTI